MYRGCMGVYRGCMGVYKSLPLMSSMVKWMELSSSSRNELDMLVFWSFIISSFML